MEAKDDKGAADFSLTFNYEGGVTDDVFANSSDIKALNDTLHVGRREHINSLKVITCDNLYLILGYHSDVLTQMMVEYFDGFASFNLVFLHLQLLPDLQQIQLFLRCR